MGRRPGSALTLVLLALIAAILAAGCSSSGAGSGDGGGGDTRAESSDTGAATSAPDGGGTGGELTVGWVFAGTADREEVSAIESAFPGRVASVVAEGAAGEPAAAAESLVSQGATLVVSEVAGTCATIPETHCVDPGGETAPGASAVSLDGEFWNRAYLLGRAAGLVTETDQIAYLAPGDSPEETAAVNAWALGCQSANPNCVVRLAVAPANPVKALRKLTRGGADVVATTLADPRLCDAAGDAIAVQPVLAPADPCGNALAVTDPAGVAEPLVQAELDGEWQGGRRITLPLGSWGSQVPQQTAAKVEDRAKEIENGRNVFVGPLFDNEGNQQVAEGEELSPDFIATQWTWLLGGVLPAG